MHRATLGRYRAKWCIVWPWPELVTNADIGLRRVPNSCWRWFQLHSHWRCEGTSHEQSRTFHAKVCHVLSTRVLRGPPPISCTPPWQSCDLPAQDRSREIMQLTVAKHTRAQHKPLTAPRPLAARLPRSRVDSPTQDRREPCS